MSLPVGVYVDNQPSLTLTIIVCSWVLSGLFAFLIFFLSHEESKIERHEWKAKMTAHGIKEDPCDCGKCKREKLTFGAILLGFIIFPLMIGFLMVMGPIALMPMFSDGNAKDAWAYVKRMDKKFNFIHFSALALPIVALLTLWWM